MHVRSTYIVIGVQNAGDVLRQVPVQNSLDVIPNINYRQVEYILVKVTHDLLYVFVAELHTESAATELCRNRTFLQGASLAAHPSFLAHIVLKTLKKKKRNVFLSFSTHSLSS